MVVGWLCQWEDVGAKEDGRWATWRSAIEYILSHEAKRGGPIKPRRDLSTYCSMVMVMHHHALGVEFGMNEYPGRLIV
jgi:hypothetical protein